ncbi:hypothetical protein KR044_006191, partial [Drosophila immigrans]
MKPVALVLLLGLALSCQARVLLSKEPLDIPVAIVSEADLKSEALPQPEALPLTQTETEAEQPKPAARLETKEEAKPEEIKPELLEEKKAELKPEEAQPEAAKPELKKEAREEAPVEIKAEQPTELKTELQPESEPELKLEAKPELQKESQPETQPESPILKALASEDVAEVAAPEAVDPVAVVVSSPEVANVDAVQPHVRQATQATPTQSSTQQNFVQQLIQNSPIGQFLSQFNGNQQQQQQQQQQQAAVQQDAAEQPATPAPTIPGFLNPGAAITSAQNAVQNAAQSVVNTTTQAFQGIQQFANNLGTQFQNTLSGLTGQQQQNAQPTPARPPGPIQSFVTNVFGGGNNATADQQPQQQGPLQGIINFLGGNRPTSAPAAAAAAAAPVPEPAKPSGVDDKIEEEPQLAASENEVRSSAEAIDDSFEEAVPANEVITVNDDAAAEVSIPEDNPVASNNNNS